MPHLVFRPKMFNGIFLTGWMLFFASWILVVAANGSFRMGVPLLVPLIILTVLCALVLLNASQQKVELDGVRVHLHDGQRDLYFRYDAIAEIRVSRGEAFDAQPQIYLSLISQGSNESEAWNLSDFGLRRSLCVALALARCAELSSIAVTLHQSREKELRAITRKMGTLVIMPRPEIEVGKSKNWFVTFALSPLC